MRTGVVCVVWIATALVYYGLVIGEFLFVEIIKLCVYIFGYLALSDQSAPGRVLFSGNFFVNNAIAGSCFSPI